ncbi:MAG: ABC transporter permease subunit [Burkholderiales bacterium]|jgi:ABC-type nitrate/sulfonate/bicarbonate transport system permease component|nr:ABC transporter permease subunit [Burkholderiales bacterium]
MKKLRNILLPLIGFAIVIAIWEIVGTRLGNSLFAPASSVLIQYLDMLREGKMLSELFTSLRQMLLGFVIACLVGMPMGIAMGRSKIADTMLRPWVSIFVVTSTAALVPILIMILGTGLTLRATVVFLAAVWYIVLTTYNGAKGISPELLAVGRSFSANRHQIFWKIILPALYPYLITGARIGLIHAIRAMVMAEMFVIIGYGALINQAGMEINTSSLLGLLLTLAFVSLIANAMLSQWGKHLAPWYEQQRQTP